MHAVNAYVHGEMDQLPCFIFKNFKPPATEGVGCDAFAEEDKNKPTYSMIAEIGASVLV